MTTGHIRPATAPSYSSSVRVGRTSARLKGFGRIAPPSASGSVHVCTFFMNLQSIIVLSRKLSATCRK